MTYNLEQREYHLRVKIGSTPQEFAPKLFLNQARNVTHPQKSLLLPYNKNKSITALQARIHLSHLSILFH